MMRLYILELSAMDLIYKVFDTEESNIIMENAWLRAIILVEILTDTFMVFHIDEQDMTPVHYMSRVSLYIKQREKNYKLGKYLEIIDTLGSNYLDSETVTSILSKVENIDKRIKDMVKKELIDILSRYDLLNTLPTFLSAEIPKERFILGYNENTYNMHGDESL